MLLVVPLYIGAAPGLLSLGALLGGAAGAGFCGVVPALLTGLFDTTVRARAVGFVYHAGSLVAAFVPPSIAWIADATGRGLGFAIGAVSGMLLIAVAAAALTLRGRALAAEPAS
jgi:SHS family lactate transporter-like MFS transporter